MTDISPIQPEAVDLPILEYGPVKHALGHIYHALDLGGPKQVIETKEIKITSRTTELAYILSDGQCIIITRRKIVRPDGVDGILKLGENGEPSKWISHKKIDEFKKKIEDIGIAAVSNLISESWIGGFQFKAEKKNDADEVIQSGLRPPQIGGLHAIGSYWSLNHQPATVVMPTGTGKTETMLATLTAYSPGKILVVVPSKVLRDQTAQKFITLGLLRKLGNLKDGLNPVVGVIEKRPRSKADLDIFDNCNVIVSTMSVFADEAVISEYAATIAEKVDVLFVDEAHHIGATGWSHFREQFLNKKILQFTATPYRRDGKLVDGKVIYEYPLQQAQKDNYFKKIVFDPVYEDDSRLGDEAIAHKAIQKLRDDYTAGYDHLLMARCDSITRARDILSIYQSVAPEFRPVIIHSESEDATEALREVKNRLSRIVVCVNMLGEGFDLPQLKIAAVHDTHKSLAILLQFTGRFTRTSGSNLGDATVIANIANADVSAALEKLYSENADWNQLLSELSSEAAKSHTRLIEFLGESQRLDEFDDEVEISHQLLRPNFNTLIFEAAKFSPKDFFKGLPKGVHVQRVWLNSRTNTLYFVTRFNPTLKWTRAKSLKDAVWDLHVLHFDSINNFLYLVSTDKDGDHKKLAAAVVGDAKPFSGDNIFRVLGRINKLLFQNVGVKKVGRRNLSFSLYTGQDVVQALSITETSGSVKSNLSGTGWEDGIQITIGCSAKGRVWSRDGGTIPELIDWCTNVGGKLRDNSIDTSQIIANVWIPEEVTSLPNLNILGVDWPLEILRQIDERVILRKENGEESSISIFDIIFVSRNATTNQIEFNITSALNGVWATYSIEVGTATGFTVTQVSGAKTEISVGRQFRQLEEYFSDYPPLIRFLDLSELDGNLHLRPQNPKDLVIPSERFETWDFTGVDITKESIWKNNIERRDSIQWYAGQHFINEEFDVVFDDDSAGEAADLICLKEEINHIRLVLVHCKYTTSANPGERIKDVVEVSTQAIRSAKWKKIKELNQHVIGRERRLATVNRATRYLAGNATVFQKLVRVSRQKEIRPEIIIIQPGLSQQSVTPDQRMVLAAAYSYLKETIGVDLDIICSQ